MQRQNRMRWLALACLTATMGRSLFLRWFCLSSARLYCRFIFWAFSGWRELLLVYLMATALLGIKRVLTAPDPAAIWHAFRAHPKNDSILIALRWFFLGKTGPWFEALALGALLFAVWAAWRARKRILIAAFANATGDTNQDAMVSGLSRRLMTELGQITDIYQHVSDDPRDLYVSDPRDLSLDDPVKLELAVEAATAFSDLKASMKDQKVEVWGLKIPLDWAATTLSALVRGPQIKGSVQKTSEGLMFEAALAGGGFDQTWRVTKADIEAEPGDANDNLEVADLMIQQLAYRIFTHLSQDEVGTSSWRATQQYTEALRAFRESNRDRSKKPSLLQQAQRGFFQAYRYDNRFGRSRYNLGVILFTQQEYEAAYQVFKRVISDIASSPPCSATQRKAARRWQDSLSRVHYAAAKSALLIRLPAYADRGLYHCDNALKLNPWNNRAWNLRSVLRNNETQRFDKETRAYVRRAAGLSWFALCAAESKGEKSKAVSSLASSHLANLALSLEGRRGSPRVMLQALRLESLNAQNSFRLGQLYLKTGQPGEALVAFETANLAQEKPTYWLWLACTRRLLPERVSPQETAEYAWKRVTEDGSDSLFEGDGITKFWTDWKKTMHLGNLQSPEFDHWRDEAARKVGLLRYLKQRGEECEEDADSRSRTIQDWNVWLNKLNLRDRLRAQLQQTRTNVASGRISVSDAIQEGQSWLDKVESDPWSSATILRALAELYRESNNPEAAQKLLKRAEHWESADKFKDLDNQASSIENVEQRKTLLGKFEGDLWSRAQVLRWLGELYTYDNQPENTQTCIKRAIDYLERDHASEIASRRLNYYVARLALDNLGNPDVPEQVDPKAMESALQLAIAALRRNPNDGLERSLLISSYLALGLPELATDELENALSLDPDTAMIREMGIDVSFRRAATITDPRLRRAAWQRMALLLQDLAAQKNILYVDRMVGWVYFYQAACQSQLSNFTTAQSCFETSFDCRFKPIESLTYLCTAYRQCNAFGEAERTYKRLVNLLKELAGGEPEASEHSPLLSLSRELKEMREIKPPALWFAWASIDTAVGMAEQGLAPSVAMARFTTGWKWRVQIKRTLQHQAAQSKGQKQQLNEDDRRSLDGGMFRCMGVILLGRARGLDPSPESAISWLKRAVKCFTRSLELTPDAGLRAFLLFRKAVAFAELAKLDAKNAAHWQDRAAEALTLTEVVDRNDEYKPRIEQLRRARGLSGSESPVVDPGPGFAGSSHS